MDTNSSESRAPLPTWSDELAVPESWPAPAYATPDVRACFYAGPPWRGKPTRVFALYGVPANAERPLPAVVLVHGGGGTAFRDWVRLWVGRGYAALAMDTCGGVPAWSESPHSQNEWPRHAHSGPNGWGGFAASGEPPIEQWMYHAVAAVLRGHSWLRAQPAVDPARIGITGVSWGGVLTCVAAGVDPRFAWAAPVYGCGHLDSHHSGFGLDDPDADPARAARWLELWDPRHYLPGAAMPFLWVTGTNDFAFPLDALHASARLTRGPRTLAVRVRMGHGHGGLGERPEEIRVFADAVVRGGIPLPVGLTSEYEGRRAWAQFDPRGAPVTGAEVCWTRALGYAADRIWTTEAAVWNPSTRRAEATLPRHATQFFFNLLDARGCVSGSPLAVTV